MAYTVRSMVRSWDHRKPAEEDNPSRTCAKVGRETAAQPLPLDIKDPAATRPQFVSAFSLIARPGDHRCDHRHEREMNRPRTQ